MNVTKLTRITSFFLLLIPTMASAEMQDIAALQQQVRQYVAANTPVMEGVRMEIEVSGVDPRLRLSNCSVPLELKTHSKSREGSRISVQVNCLDENKWSIYVPVSIEKYSNVLISKSHLRKGRTLTPNDIAWTERKLSTLPGGYFIQAKDVIGMFARRNIRNGTVIAPKHLRPPFTVHKGESVTIRAVIGGVEVKMNGKAMSDGSTGDIIKVTNRSSNRTVEAEVIRPGVVQVRL